PGFRMAKAKIAPKSSRTPGQYAADAVRQTMSVGIGNHEAFARRLGVKATVKGFPTRPHRPGTTSGARSGSTESAVDFGHLPFAVSRARRRRQGSLELRQIGRGEHHIRGGHVLLEVFAPLRPRNRRDVLAPAQEPGERDLTRRRAFSLRHVLHRGCDAHVRFEVRALEPRVVPAEVALREGFGALNSPG